MPDGQPRPTARTLTGMHDIAAAEWDACAGPDHPFVSHAFLSALEDSGSVAAKTGWLPRHVVVEDPDGRVLAVAPLYLKSHSYGEYVFDHGWARAYEQAGGQYYPKLQVSVPFTPVTGPRLMVRPGAETARPALIDALEQIADRMAVSSLHVTFPTEAEADSLEGAGWLRRLDVQYHWTNRDYEDFDGFLADLASRKRKAIRKERGQVRDQGIAFRTLSGDDLETRHWDAFFAFYMDTGNRKWGIPYLNRDFFDLLHDRLRHRVVLVMAFVEGHPVAGALNLQGGDTLYGRNWGCVADFKFLHFETCYYRAIDHAIAHGLKRVEAGAQGQHKIQRGYLPTLTHSAHRIADPGFADAIARYLAHEREGVRDEMADLMSQSPFRQEA